MHDPGTWREAPRWSLTAALLLSALLPCPPLGAQALPAGFVDEAVAGGFAQPVALAFLPDGRFLVGEQRTGRIVLVAGALQAPVGGVRGVSQGAEQGLLGLAVDPGWPQRPYVYVHYTHAPTSSIRVARLRAQGLLMNATSTLLSLDEEYLVLAGIPDTDPIHNGGTLRFDGSGLLYVSIGDDNQPCSAQLDDGFNGRILRLDVSGLPDGAGGPPALAALVPGGTAPGTASDRARLTWVKGLRNPFRFHIDPLTNQVFTTDVGQASYEEVDVSTTGTENFGWPWLEGPQPGFACSGVMPALTAPAVAFNRIQTLAPVAFVSFAFYRSKPAAAWDFGPAYDGSYFYLEFYSGVLRRLTWNGVAWTPAPAVPGQPNATDWATGLGWIADATRGSDGRIYYVRQVTGEVRAIRPEPGPAPQTRLTILGGDGQTASAGRWLAQPLVVRHTDASGLPVAGAPISFLPSSGTVSASTVTTNTGGLAATTFTMPQTFSSHPTVTARTPQGDEVVFHLRWRGLTAAATWLGGGAVLYVRVHHSETGSPFSLALEPPSFGPLSVPGGVLWTSILQPQPNLLVLDGLGILGPPHPAFVTGTDQPVWEAALAVPPGLTGLTLVLQAFALDSSLLPSSLALMISNPQVVTLL